MTTLSVRKASLSKPRNFLRFGVAILPLIPACKINLDAAAGQGETWAVVGIAFVLFGALAIEHSLHADRWHKATLWGVIGVAFLVLNAMNAIGNLACHTDHSRDENRARMQLASDRIELSQRRKEHVKLAGEATPGSIEAEIKAVKATNSKLWQASENCNPNSITRDATRSFCKAVADLEARKAAAVKRDAIDASLANVAALDTPSTVDSFADAMTEAMTAFGYQIDEKAKLAIVRARDWGKAIGVEVLAMFGPAALLGLFLRPSATIAATIRDDRRRNRRKPSGDDDIDAFFADKLETSSGVAIPAGLLFKTWQSWCAEAGREPGTQKAFGLRVQRRAQRDPNNGRPRYLGIQLKGARPSLRLAVNNT